VVASAPSASSHDHSTFILPSFCGAEVHSAGAVDALDLSLRSWQAHFALGSIAQPLDIVFVEIDDRQPAD
jgi:hypothetical protein